MGYVHPHSYLNYLVFRSFDYDRAMKVIPEARRVHYYR